MLRARDPCVVPAAQSRRHASVKERVDKNASLLCQMRLIPVERSWFPSCKQPAGMRTLTGLPSKNSGSSRANNVRTEEAHQTKAWRTRSSASSLIVRLQISTLIQFQCLGQAHALQKLL